ncbi:MAG TPA: heme o synthase [Planctomycetota bacterium]|nr:heme o synthase [Planctomycetota bacterium]
MKPSSLAGDAPAVLELPALEEAPLRVSGSPGLAAMIQDCVELTKLRVTLLVLLTALVGYIMASRHTGVAPDLWTLVCALVGTALVAAGAAAVNQVLERDRDARMERTRARPIPSGRLGAHAALSFSAAATLSGLALLLVGVNGPATAAAAATFALYAFIYTPLKTRTHLSTVVGAVPGALPPLIGWLAAGGDLSGPAWILFGILFFWQLPHFLAIAWLHREDYARGGYPILTVIDPTGVAMGRQAVLNGMALLPVSLLPAVVRQNGPAYFWIALGLGLAFLFMTGWLAVARSRLSARAALIASLLYLPALLVSMVLDRGAH